MSALRVVVWSVVGLACVLAAFLGGYYLRPSEPVERPARITFLAAAPDDFYQVVIAGARAAAAEADAELQCIVPADLNEQSATLSGLNADNTDGVAISPRSPRNQTRMLSRLATIVPVITYDNDAPESLRHCYVGTDNYSGGQMSARLVKEILPDGGKVAIFIGDVERDNAQLRRLGFIDELLGRPRGDSPTIDPVDIELEGNGYGIVGTFLDDHDEDMCRDNVRKVLAAHDDCGVLVGLYGYVAPACLEVVDELGKQGEVKIVGFDEHQSTLDGIEQGKVAGTIVQDPYRYGYQSVQLLASWCNDPFATPTSGSGAPVLIPCRRIGPDNIAEYRGQLKQYLDGRDNG